MEEEGGREGGREGEREIDRGKNTFSNLQGQVLKSLGIQGSERCPEKEAGLTEVGGRNVWLCAVRGSEQTTVAGGQVATSIVLSPLALTRAPCL